MTSSSHQFSKTLKAVFHGSFGPPHHAVLLRVHGSTLFTAQGLTTMTSASFHGVVGLQNGSRYQIDKKNFWRYDGFLATPEIEDIRVYVFTFSANTNSAEDRIYRNTIRRNCICRIGRCSADRSYCQRSRGDSNFGSISEIIDAIARHADFESQHQHSWIALEKTAPEIDRISHS
ncbi:hypothetical protein BDR03DRAFT_270912 [Suillus americanus]|nr:hypothetical protein BDR03DRAFT_270912 [Suillus americanus]